MNNNENSRSCTDPTTTSSSSSTSPGSTAVIASAAVVASAPVELRQRPMQEPPPPEPATLDDDETASTLFVLFKLDSADYALPANVVMQMETYTGATTVPGAPPFVVGIIQLRGRVIPVVDLRVRFGLPPQVTTLETRVVVGEIHHRAVALVVDSAREVARMTRTQQKPPPRLLQDGARGFVKAVAQLGERTVMVLDFAKVIGEEALDVV